MDEKRMRKRLKRVTVACVCISILLLAGGVAASVLLERTFKDSVNNQIEAETEEYKINISRKMEADRQTLDTLASFLEFSDSMDTDLFVRGLYESNNSNGFVRMGYFSKNGKGVRVTINGAVEQELSAKDMNPNLYAILQESWNGENGISNVYYDTVLKEELIAYTVPVEQDGQVIGALSASDKVDVFSDILKGSSLANEQGAVHIIDSKGNFVIRSEGVLSQESIHSIYDQNMMGQKEEETVKEALKQGKSCHFQMTYKHIKYSAFVESIGINDWHLVLIKPESELNGPLYQNVLVTRIIFGMILLLTVACILYGYQWLRKSNKELLSLAYYDPLTKAFNMEKFGRDIEQALEEGANLSIVAMNIRQFKFINEIFGSEVADQFLCRIKEVLDKEMRGGEFFCRESSDYFFFLLREHEKAQIRKRLERIANEVGRIPLNHHQNYQVAVYFGVVTGEDIDYGKCKKEEVMTHVMFALKKAGKDKQNSICFYDMELYKTEQLQNYIESHMKQALKDGEFRLFLQPKIDMKRQRLSGAEALVRWVTKEGAMIFPDQFISVFEQNGFCTKLDLYMVEQACRQIREWIDAGKEEIPISVNQSKILFYEAGYVENLCRITQKYQISESLITLEILEGLAFENVEEFNSRIRELRERGFKISMDDFGSGYSSLNTLAGLEIDELKLDRAFLMEMRGQKKRQQVIIAQIVELAKKMNISTVAEGVETVQDEEFMIQSECDFGQGYYYSRPISVAEFEKKYLS